MKQNTEFVKEKLDVDFAEHLRMLLQVSEEGLLLHEGGIIQFVNDTCYELFGYSSGELLGKPVFMLVSPDEQDRVKRAMHKEAEGTFESYGLRKDGSLFPMQTRIKNIGLGQRKLRLVGIKNLIQQEKDRKKLAEAQYRLRMAITSSRLGSFEAVEIGKKVFWDEGMYRIFDVEEGSVENLHSFYMSCIHPDDQAYIKSSFRKSLDPKRKEEYFKVSCRIITPMQRTKHVECEGRFQRDTRGYVINFFGICRDITDEVLQRQALNESEKRFKSIFQHAEVGIALVRENGVPFFINDALQKFTGYSERELLDRSFTDFTHLDDIEKDVREFHKLVSGEINTFSMEKRYIHKDGKIVWGYLT
ncbi:MAG: PAS domain S-box protein, partial [Bacteroidota bacterium]